MPFFSSSAQEQGLRLDIEFKGARTSAPILARATLAYSGGRLLEGRLELVLRSAGQVIATCRSGELALAPGGGEKAFDLLLPISWSGLRDNELDVYPRFITERGEIRLPRVLRPLPEAWERSCVVAVSRIREVSGEGRNRMDANLGLEQFRPKLPERSRRTLSTTTVGIAPDDLPIQPLAYTAFDLLFLPGKGFAFLRDSQLAAIARWVRAGGSVCIVPSGTLTKGHVQFLNGLGDGGPLFLLDAAGQLVANGKPQVSGKCSAHLLRAGLGRAAVITATPDDKDYDFKASAPWRSILAFLWRIRAAQLDSIRQDGRWRSDLHFNVALGDEDFPIPDEGENRDAAFEARLGALRADGLPAAGLRLMPQEVRRISFAAVLLVLALFVVLIGPVDYFLLGLLRIRKFTWLFLPIVAGLFTYFMVRLSEYYMGMHDRRHAVVFVDVDHKGEPVRQCRFELLFPGRERVLSMPLKSSLLNVVQYGRVSGQAFQRRGPIPQMEGGSGGGDPTLCLEGSLLGQATATHTVRQWSPVLYRTFSLDPPDHAMKIDWDAVTLLDFARAEDRYRVPEKLVGSKARDCAFFLFNRRDYYPLGGNLRAYAFLSQPLFGRGDTVLQAVSSPPQYGLFSIVSQVSPTGAVQCEDMAMIDPTDPTKWLLVVVEAVGDDLFVYRRIYQE
ncbi:MAG: hypothetical protein FJ291_02285 [Planctomycetes bacterium]|nr:hypothetical protein [Planctomycetota bacterium]